MLEVPDFLGWLSLFEKQQVGSDVGVWLEHAVGQTNDGVEIALFEQMFLQPGLHISTEQRTIRQNHGCNPAITQKPDNQSEKESQSDM